MLKWIIEANREEIIATLNSNMFSHTRFNDRRTANSLFEVITHDEGGTIIDKNQRPLRETLLTGNPILVMREFPRDLL